MVVAATAVMMVEIMAMTPPSDCIRCVVEFAVNPSGISMRDECLQAMEAMKQRLEDLERVVEDDYKFLNRNVRNFLAWSGT
jgi:hypothetical protein